MGPALGPPVARDDVDPEVDHVVCPVAWDSVLPHAPADVLAKGGRGCNEGGLGGDREAAVAALLGQGRAGNSEGVRDDRLGALRAPDGVVDVRPDSGGLGLGLGSLQDGVQEDLAEPGAVGGARDDGLAGEDRGADPCPSLQVARRQECLDLQGQDRGGEAEVDRALDEPSEVQRVEELRDVGVQRGVVDAHALGRL
eukprot:7445890-Pyramimonas_sp.AAC.1